MRLRKQFVALILSFFFLFVATGLVRDAGLFIGIICIVTAHSLMTAVCSLEDV